MIQEVDGMAIGKINAIKELIEAEKTEKLQSRSSGAMQYIWFMKGGPA